jgi:MYXO-CTERM domain-containing protein
MSGTDPLFVDAANYDYHLQAGSPAIGKAVAAPVVGNVVLTPIDEYVQPLQSVPRASANDLGAFEYGTNTADAGESGGMTNPFSGGSEPALEMATDGGDDADAPTLGSSSGAGSSGGGASSGGVASSGGAASSGGSSSGAGASGDGGASADRANGTVTAGCGCRTAEHGRAAGGLAGLVLAALFVLRRVRAPEG